MEAFCYKWTRISTGEYYIGIHKGDVDDGYIGSGKVFRDKYDNTQSDDWKREIITFGSFYEVAEIEKDLVTEETLKDPLCLNKKSGGIGGSDKNHSKESREKRSKSLMGHIVSSEVRESIRKARTGSKASIETKMKMSKSHTGKKQSDETKAKKSAILTGKKQTTKTCPHCGKTGGNAMTRWHFNNCKDKDNG